MIQWTITIIIVAAAITYAGYRVYKHFSKTPSKDDEDCDSCSSDCSNCPLMEPTGKFHDPGKNTRDKPHP
ncbi:MAG: FeoB-associated Cys-rich membrane protein [Bacteroidetes bacterium]|nr:MAG: FeoB-associated Cys-rich membrane protein [Bacteroidota bacterium]